MRTECLSGRRLVLVPDRPNPIFRGAGPDQAVMIQNDCGGMGQLVCGVRPASARPGHVFHPAVLLPVCCDTSIPHTRSSEPHQTVVEGSCPGRGPYSRPAVPITVRAMITCRLQHRALRMCAGLKSLASLQSTRQLDDRTAASVALTWQPGLGTGLQLQTNRQLTERVQGECSLLTLY